MEVQAIPEGRIQSPSAFLNHLLVNYFPAASGPLCYRRALIRSSINMNMNQTFIKRVFKMRR